MTSKTTRPSSRSTQQLTQSVHDCDGQVAAGQGYEGEQSSAACARGCNVGPYERLASLTAGSLLGAFGLFRAQRGRLALAGLGAALVGRGISGRCKLYERLGVNTAAVHHGEDAEPAPVHGYKVEKSVTINRTPSDLYAFWRDLENLPTVMRHLRRVDVVDRVHSHWVASGPLGREVEWDAEIINDRENEVVAWRSLPGGAVDTAGSVHFKQLSHGRGAEVAVSLAYDPPAGSIGGWAATLLGDDPAHTIAEDLHNFKRFMETGELPTTEGQSSGRRRGSTNPRAQR